MLVPWCAWLLSSTLEVLRLRLRLRTFYGSIKQLSCLSVLFYLGPFCLGPFCRGYFVESGHFVCVFYKNNKKRNKSFLHRLPFLILVLLLMHNAMPMQLCKQL